MTIELFGEIVSDDWVWIYELFGIPCCCPRNVRDAIRDLPEGEDLILEINSPGGDVWAGFEIYGLLQACKASTEAHIIAMAASAATTVMCGCDLVLASPVAQIMIHQPAAYVEEYLNNTGTRQLQNFLDSVKASIINSYVIKCAGKTSRKKLEQLVDDSTYMPAQDALELGLIDGYLDLDDAQADLLPLGSGIRVSNMAGLSAPPKTLLARYEAAVLAGTMDAAPEHPVPSDRGPKGLPGPPGVPAAPLLDRSDVDAVEGLISDWRLMAAIDLERARAVE